MRPAAWPSRSTVPIVCSTATKVTMPPTSRTVGQSMRETAALPAAGSINASRAPNERANADVRIEARRCGAKHRGDETDHADDRRLLIPIEGHTRDGVVLDGHEFGREVGDADEQDHDVEGEPAHHIAQRYPCQPHAGAGGGGEHHDPQVDAANGRDGEDRDEDRERRELSRQWRSVERTRLMRVATA